MIPLNLGGEQGADAWRALDSGAPTISAFAELCRLSIIHPPDAVETDALSAEAKTVLVCGGERGVVDLRASKDDFDAVERFLAVCVETEPDSRLLFLNKEDPLQTVAFLEGFAQLCRSGLVLHHLGRDFSFSKTGFAVAKELRESGEEKNQSALIDFATRLDH